MVTEPRIELNVNYGAQADFLNSEERFPALIAGRGFGKTLASLLKVVKYTSEHPNGYGMYTVPHLGDIDRILLPTMRKFFRDVEGKLWVWKEKKAEFYFPQTNFTVFVRPASEPDSVRGFRGAFGAMDEIGRDNQFETFNNLQAGVTEPTFPNQLWVTTTPRVEASWIKDIWQNQVDPHTREPLPNPEDFPVFRGATIENPHAPEWLKELALAQKDTRWGRQEYWAEFLSVEGLAFELDPEKHLKHKPASVEVVKTVTGLDIGMSSPTSLHICHLDRQNRVWVEKEFYKPNATEWDWINWCAENNVKKIVCDPSISDDMLKQYRRRYNVFVARSWAKSRPDRLNLWRSRLTFQAPDQQPTIFISPDCPNLWDELTNLHYPRPQGKEYTLDKWAPECADHAYDDVAYALSDLERVRLTLPRINQSFRGW